MYSGKIIKRQSNLSITYMLLLAFFVKKVGAECNVCQENRAACINSTSYYLCFDDDVPHEDQLFHCLDGLECTDLTAICAQKNSQRPPSCGDTSQCGLCSAHHDYKFACLSLTIFQMCYGASRPTGQFGYCPSGYVCDASSDSFCLPIQQVNQYTCGLADELVDTTPTSSSSTSTQSVTESSPVSSTSSGSLSGLEICEQKGRSGLFPSVPQDPACKNYIYCRYKNEVIKATEYTCAENSWFQPEYERCGYIKPSNCL